MSGQNVLMQSLIKPGTNTHFLVISPRGFEWINSLREMVDDVHLASNPEECDKVLATQKLDIIIYDDTAFDVPAKDVIEDFRFELEAAGQ